MPSPAGHLCGTCLQHPPAFDRTLAIFHYSYPLDHLLHQFKYQQHLALGRLLTQLVLQPLPTLTITPRPDMLIAMPMHRNRLQARGFNHAHALASDLARQWQIPYGTEVCTRIKDTPMQAGLDMKTRTRNLRDAFSSDYPFAGQHVAVMDDVMTTGASMHALARILKQAGAAQVSAIVVARTLRASEDR